MRMWAHSSLLATGHHVSGYLLMRIFCRHALTTEPGAAAGEGDGSKGSGEDGAAGMEWMGQPGSGLPAAGEDGHGRGSGEEEDGGSEYGSRDSESEPEPESESEYETADEEELQEPGALETVLYCCVLCVLFYNQAMVCCLHLATEYRHALHLPTGLSK